MNSQRIHLAARYTICSGRRAVVNKWARHAHSALGTAEATSTGALSIRGLDSGLPGMGSLAIAFDPSILAATAQVGGRLVNSPEPLIRSSEERCWLPFAETESREWTQAEAD